MNTGMHGSLERLALPPRRRLRVTTSCECRCCAGFYSVGFDIRSNLFSAMSFLLASGSADQITEWQTLTADQRSTIRSQYNAAGIALVASAFGGTEQRESGLQNATIFSAATDFLVGLQPRAPATLQRLSPRPWASGSWTTTWMVSLL